MISLNTLWRRQRLQTRLILLMATVAIGLIGLTTLIFYETAQARIRIDIRQRLHDIVAIAAANLDGDRHAALVDPAQEQSADYRSIQGMLQRIQQAASDVHFIYTMRIGQNSSIEFVVDAETDPSQMARLGEIYDDASPLLQARFASLNTPLVEQHVYTDEWGAWLSGYAPFYDAAGKRAGVVGVDIAADTLAAYLQQLRILSLSIFGGVIPLILLAGFLTARAIVTPIARIKSGAIRIGAGDLTCRIDVDRKDEIGVLADEFNHMAEQLGVQREKLNALAKKYQNIVENAVEGIFQSTLEGDILTANRSMIHMLGYMSLTDINQKLTHLETQLYANPADRDRLLRQLQADGRIREFTVQLRRADASLFWVEINARLTYDDTGRIVIEGMIRDISERIARETAEKESRAAQAASQAKSEFLANMSHEIRTPLNAIMGLTDIVLHSNLGVKQRAQLEKVKVSSKSLLAVINDILDLSKIEAGHMELEAIDFSLFDVMSNLTEMFAHKAHQQQIELLMSIEKEAPWMLNGDPTRLSQILINLIGNALKFTQQGEITIRVALVTSDDPQTIALQFSVKDTGSGIKPETLEKIFDSFSQADASITRNHGGTGLGLTICRRLTELMGGRIWAESRENEGSAFFFTARFKPAKAKTGERPVVPTDLRGLRVLVADDNATSLNIMTEILTSFDMHTVAVSSGVQALDALKASNQPFDLVLMDWKMPGLNGIDTARRIKQDLGLNKMPIVCMVSAYGREDLLQQTDRTFLDGFLHKPINQSLLFDKIMELFGKRRAQPDEALVQSFTHAMGQEGAQPPCQAHVLLVEDNAINQEVALEWLHRAGLRVDVAENGIEALQAIAKQHFDLILMDIQMPKMDGLTATRRIRNLQNAELRVPIIAMTAHALKGDREKCLEAGMDDYITKPIDPRELVDMLSRWLQNNAIEPDPSPGIKLTDPPDNAPPDDLPGIDQAAGLYRVNQNQKLYRKLLKSFYRDYRDTQPRMHSCLNQGQLDQARQLAHAIKGVAGNIGAMALSQAAATLEAELVQGRFSAPSHRGFDQALAEVIDGLARLETPVKSARKARREPDSVESRNKAIAQTIPVLDQIRRLLDDDLETARSLIGSLDSGITGRPPAGELFDQLNDRMDEFDIDGAEVHIERIKHHLEKEIGS